MKIYLDEDIAKVREALEQQKDYIESRLSAHDNIRADDDQYEDPEEWELRPKLKFVVEALAILDAGKSVEVVGHIYNIAGASHGVITQATGDGPLYATKEDV